MKSRADKIHSGKISWLWRVAAALLLILAAGPLQAASADPFADIPSRVQPYVDQGVISGAVMLVADRDKVLHLSAVGKSDLVSGRAMKTDDIFWIASMTKPVTSLAVAMLADDGKLAFDDPVEKYLPEFKGMWVEQERAADRRILVKASRPITLRDLMTHLSGIGEYQVSDPHWTLSERAKLIAREPMRRQPGTRWTYSTAGTDVLGRVVEVVSGVSFDRFLDQRLFDPLGMKETTFWLTPAQYKRYARSYKPGPDGKLVETTIAYMHGGAVTDHARPPLGGAGLFTTAEEISRVYQMMLNGGVWHGRRILKAETVAEMTRKQTGDIPARPGMPWGLGFSIIEDPSQMEANKHYAPGSFGHGGAFGTNSWADPQTGIVHIFMIQRDAMVPANIDDSVMRRAYEEGVAAGLK